MTDTYADIRERLAKATPGEWGHFGGTYSFAINAIRGPRKNIRVIGHDLDIFCDSHRSFAQYFEGKTGYTFCPANAGILKEEDAAFIAHAPTDISKLLADNDRLREALKLWLDYDNCDEADFSSAGPMLLYAKALEATRQALKDTP